MFFAQAQGNEVVGKPAYNFMAPGTEGKCECSFSFEAGSKTDMIFDNSMEAYRITHETRIQGLSLIVNVNINQKFAQ